MKQRIKPKQIYLVLFALSASTFFLSHCMSKNDTIKATVTAPVFEDYAGSQKCGSCHKDIYEQYVQTSHHFTSMPAEGKNINGSFGNNKNFFSYNRLLKVAMEKKDSGFYQAVYYKNVNKTNWRFDSEVP